jgi:aquaporin Z
MTKTASVGVSTRGIETTDQLGRTSGAVAERPVLQEGRPRSTAQSNVEPAGRTRARRHWVEYGIEAAALGVFMIVAAAGATLLQHPASPVRQAIADPVVRRLLMGLAMGLTVIAIVYSPWGTRSGAHLNPAFTFTFFRLGKVPAGDTLGYAAAQFTGAVAGILLAALLLRGLLAAPQVNYVATLPGRWGSGLAFLGELTIAFIQMTMVLHVSNTRRLAPYTGVFAGALVAIYIVVEEPLSGMSLNPARSFGPALLAQAPGTLWIYFAGPQLGMLLAAETYVRTRGLASVFCAKLHHGAHAPCPFNCRYHEMPL